jgi:hypothetical protein
LSLGAHSGEAHVVHGARVVVVARRRVVVKDTALIRVAGIICTQVVVITHNRSSHAPAAATLLPLRAQTAVIAGRVVIYKHAARDIVTRIISARIAVIADQRRGPHALTQVARILGCTHIIVITRGRIQGMNTAVNR